MYAKDNPKHNEVEPTLQPLRKSNGGEQELIRQENEWKKRKPQEVGAEKTYTCGFQSVLQIHSLKGVAAP